MTTRKELIEALPPAQGSSRGNAMPSAAAAHYQTASFIAPLAQRLRALIDENKNAAHNAAQATATFWPDSPAFPSRDSKAGLPPGLGPLLPAGLSGQIFRRENAWRCEGPAQCPGRGPPPVVIAAVEAFELNDSGARFRRIGRLSFPNSGRLFSDPARVERTLC